MHVVPQIRYLGEYPTSRLVDGSHAGFKVGVKAHLWAAAGTKGTITVAGSWGQTARLHVTVPAGDSVSLVPIDAAATDVKLWWPAGHGPQPLYNLTVSFEPDHATATVVSTTRQIGFRVFAVVTGNDTDAEWVKHNANGDGTASHGMYWRINGDAILAGDNAALEYA